MPLPFEQTYRQLPTEFYADIEPTPVEQPSIIEFNGPLAKSLQLDSPAFAEIAPMLLSGNKVIDSCQPLAQAYAGHQFGNFTASLGDGRAILLGEVRDNRGNLKDIQLKGAGRTPFSRNGDGRATLGAVMREYLLSEGMYALGVPTTRSLAIVQTGEPVFRKTPEPGAILTRVSSSHIRVGTFEYFAARGDFNAVKRLTDYAIEHHHPESLKTANPYRTFFEQVVEKQAKLIAQWVLFGFIHGVMNTDNMTISGETIDYGPCAFLDEYNPQKTFSSIDAYGRYRFDNQGVIGQWNLARLAESLLPLFQLGAIQRDAKIGEFDASSNQGKAAIEFSHNTLENYFHLFQNHRKAGLLAKCGFQPDSTDEDQWGATQALLQHMAEQEADYTQTFSILTCMAENSLSGSASFFDKRPQIQAWFANWKSLHNENLKSASAAMREVNPYVIPRNHRVAEAIQAAYESGDFKPMRQMLDAISTPFEAREKTIAYQQPPTPQQRVTETFCGT